MYEAIEKKTTTHKQQLQQHTEQTTYIKQNIFPEI